MQCAWGQVHAAPRCNGAQTQIDVRPRQQLRLRCLQLVQQRGTHVAGADHPHCERLWRQPEAGMRRTQRTGGVRTVDGHRNIAFRRTLRDRQDVHPGASQCLEQTCRHARLPRHAVTHRGQHAHLVPHLHTLHLAHAQLMREGLQQRLPPPSCLAATHHAADRMFGRPLGDHHHRHLCLPQRRKHAFGGTGHADQAGAFQIEHGQLRTQGEPLDRPADGALGSDPGAGVRRLECVADQDRQAALDGRRHRLRMHHPGAKVRQFAGLVVAERVQLHGLGHQPWIGRQHAVHIRPYLQFGGIEQGREDRPGIIAAIAAKRGDAVLAVAGDEPGDHHARLRIGLPPRLQALRADGPVNIHAQFAMLHHQHLARIQHRARMAQRPEVLPQQMRGTHFTQALHAVQYLIWQATDHRQRIQQSFQLGKARIQPFHAVARVLAQQRGGSSAMPGAQVMPGIAPVRRAGRCHARQADQCIGHALHRRYDGDLHGLRPLQQQLRDMAVTVGIGNGRTAELVHHYAW